MVKGGEEEEQRDERKPDYVCEICNSLFFRLEDVRFHKAMTGHGRFIERKSKQ